MLHAQRVLHFNIIFIVILILFTAPIGTLAGAASMAVVIYQAQKANTGKKYEKLIKSCKDRDEGFQQAIKQYKSEIKKLKEILSKNMEQT